MLQSFKPIPDTFDELAEHVFNRLPKTKRFDFVTDSYKSCQYNHMREHVEAHHLPVFWLGQKQRPHNYDWPSFMSKADNKTQLIKLLLEQWKTEK